LRTCSIADYLEDICSVADTLTATPVMIGHSMGGFIVQNTSRLTSPQPAC
jgi:alpha-beta hydrolase superfamily lysophospholipase